MVANVDYVCFTGSVATGRKVAVAAAEAFIPANLELGGKDPMIIMASADPVEAARTALRASILATGQACQSIERLYVARPIYDKFLETLVNEAEKVRLNYPDIHQARSVRLSSRRKDRKSPSRLLKRRKKVRAFWPGEPSKYWAAAPICDPQ
nr:aldehyde dehydrogenase family protein [Sphingopyxis sp. BSNA05]